MGSIALPFTLSEPSLTKIAPLDLAPTTGRRIIATGHATQPNGSTVGILLRYLDNGALDKSFGTGGVRLDTGEPSLTALTRILPLSNGNLAILGYSATSKAVYLTVVTSDGAPAPDFNGGQKLLLAQPVETADLSKILQDLSLVHDGNLAIATWFAGNYDSASETSTAHSLFFSLVSPKGERISSWTRHGIDPLLTGQLPRTCYRPERVKIFPQGHVGLLWGHPRYFAAVTRFTKEGTEHEVFNGKGFIELLRPVNFVGGISFFHYALDTQELLYASQLEADGENGLGVARFTPKGFLDETFGNRGFFFWPVGLYSTADTKSIATHTGRSLLVASVIVSTMTTKMGLHRITPDGKADTTFRDDGELSLWINVGQSDNPAGSVTAIKSLRLIPQADSRFLLLVGYSGNMMNQYYVLSRFNGDETIGQQRKALRTHGASPTFGPFSATPLLFEKK